MSPFFSILETDCCYTYINHKEMLYILIRYRDKICVFCCQKLQASSVFINMIHYYFVHEDCKHRGMKNNLETMIGFNTKCKWER